MHKQLPRKLPKRLGHMFLFAAALSLSVSFAFFPVKSEPANPPNILLLVSDALRPDALGVYGSENPTPNIDRLAASGTVFEHAYSTAGWTMPSAASIFSGQYADVCVFENALQAAEDRNETDPSGANNGEKYQGCLFSDGSLLLAEELQEQGYDNRYDIENTLPTKLNVLQGFLPLEHSDYISVQERRELEQVVGYPLKYARPQQSIPEELLKLFPLCRSGQGRCDSSDGRSFGMLNAIMQHDPNKPFFFVKWFLDPHGGYNPPPRFSKHVDEDPNKLSQHPVWYRMRKVSRFADLPPQEVAHVKNLYMGEVQLIDELVGLFLAALEVRGLEENTYVILAADHGELIGEGGRWGHTVKGGELVMRVPLIIAGPKIPAGKRIASPVSLIDLMPTLKELLALDFDDEMQGRSVYPLLNGDLRRNAPLYFSAWRPGTSRRFRFAKQGPWMLHLDYAERAGLREVAAFNLERDPYEQHQVVPQASEEKVIEQLVLDTLETIKEGMRLHEKNKRGLLDEKTGLDAKTEGLEKALRALGYIE